MNEDEWQFPAPMEDPEIYQAGLVRDDKGRARLVLGDNVVEGEEDDGRKGPPSCPFSS